MIKSKGNQMPSPYQNGEKAIKKSIRSHQMIVFFVLTFLISWFPWYMGIAVEMLIIGPSVAAFIVVFFLDGKTGLAELFRPFLRWRASAYLWLIALFGTAVLFLIGVGIYGMFGGELPPFTIIKSEYSLLPIFIFLVLLLPFTGPVGEVFGWRGFAQPRLQASHGPLAASLVIGVLWGIWHLPDLMEPTSVLGSLKSQIGLGFVVLYTFSNIASSVYITWLYNKTKKSALIAAVGWHAATDFWAILLISDGSLRAAQQGVMPMVGAALYLTVLAVLIAGAVILVFATKGRLGLTESA